MNYYNDHDKGAAAWLRELIKAGHIPPGIVDERSITEVKKEDLAGFTQCHFFCGIEGWPLALRLAGIPAETPLWTGSPPCQPFSVAGKQLGQLDERHLAPTFMRLVDQCRPAILFGEQVAAAIGKHWLDDLFLELERQGYACGATVLPAASVGAPHKRDRLFFGAYQLANTNRDLHSRALGRSHAEAERIQAINRAGFSGTGEPGGTGQSLSVRLADTDDARPQGRGGMPERADQQPAGAAGVDGELAHAAVHGYLDPERPEHVRRMEQQQGRSKREDERQQSATERGSEFRGMVRASADPHHGFWSDADWLGCRDGKFRPVRSGTFPLANGIPARVGRLRGYGNAIVPQAAAEFIKAFTGAIHDNSN